jgi:vesicle-fusing ATPase
VRVDLPDKEGRHSILKLHCRNKPLAADVNLEKIAQESYGFSGAHLESVTNEAAILALREQAEEIAMIHFKEAVDKVIMGEKMDRKPGVEERYRIAVHETGHALVSELIRPGSVSHLTITNRGRALGYMRQVPEDDQYLYTREYLEKQIRVFLAGAVSEDLILESRSTGASGDFDQAVQVARQIINAGLSPLGVVCDEIISNEVLHKEVQDIIKEQDAVVVNILTEKRMVLEKIAGRLLDQEYLSGDNIRAYLDSHEMAAVAG